MANVFTYGSLMYSPVWLDIVSQPYSSKIAKLSDFVRYGVKGEAYPVAVPQLGNKITGLLYFDVSDADIKRLDIFEGEYYQRRQLQVEFDNGEFAEADCYILKPDYYPISDNRPWSVEKFEQSGLQMFLNQYNGFNAIKT